MATIDRTDTNIGKDVEELQCQHTASGHVNGLATQQSTKAVSYKGKHKCAL